MNGFFKDFISLKLFMISMHGSHSNRAEGWIEGEREWGGQVIVAGRTPTLEKMVLTIFRDAILHSSLCTPDWGQCLHSEWGPALSKPNNRLCCLCSSRKWIKALEAPLYNETVLRPFSHSVSSRCISVCLSASPWVDVYFLLVWGQALLLWFCTHARVCVCVSVSECASPGHNNEWMADICSLWAYDSTEAVKKTYWQLSVVSEAVSGLTPLCDSLLFSPLQIFPQQASNPVFFFNALTIMNQYCGLSEHWSELRDALFLEQFKGACVFSFLDCIRSGCRNF